ncbi:hypothetical protein F4859DRAFT_507197 [Xylaria cf. heliscus]|nr:hypothetical protein F4859DRAFT_507197 [Xylaria cf. heliscus]
MLLSLVLRLAGLAYYTQLGDSADLMIVTILLVWKTGYRRISSILVTRGWALALSALFTGTSFLLLPLVWDYGRKAKPPIWIGPGRPFLFPSRIMNTTLYPKRSFEYSTVLIGVPVGWSGIAGGLVSVDCQIPGFKPWYTVDAVDHLMPGSSHLGLRGKLDEFLNSQGIETSRYPYAYLVTTSGSTGYGHTHLTFWYLYSAEKQLTAIITEINNAFGKRLPHILFQKNNNIEDVNCDTSVMSSGPVSRGNGCQKELHGSTFIFRNGIYSLVASDPLSPNMEGMGLINNTVHLMSSEGREKVLARIISTPETIDTLQLSLNQRLSFIFRWWWKEAAILFVGRGSHIQQFLRFLKESITRDTAEVECGLELVFRNYLRHLVKQSASSLIVRYVPASVPDAIDEEIFVHYAHDFEAIFCEFNENHTIWLSEPTLLPKLVFKKPSPPLSTASYLDYAYFTFIKNLRKLPEKIQRPSVSRQRGTVLEDIRDFRLSSMDGYVLAHEEDKTRYIYRHLVLKLFIADRIVWGSIRIVSLAALFLRMMLAWIIVLL